MNQTAAHHPGPVDAARWLLRQAGAGYPVSAHARAILAAIELVLRSGDEEAREELLLRGFLRDSQSRYEEYVAPRMRAIGPASFEMGTLEERTRHFCGEAPRHTVILSPYLVSEVTVTNRLLALMDERRRNVPVRARDQPAGELTWWEASLFALWVGCRLPTEAEWEFACGAGSECEWCCPEESELYRHGWFSENSGYRLQPVATLEPNKLGLYDLHGNVWEWCGDDYDQDFYRHSPSSDPVNRDGTRTRSADRVCRGGSVYALAEMCRTRYRFHESPCLWARDLGFRLARSTGSPFEELEA